MSDQHNCLEDFQDIDSIDPSDDSDVEHKMWDSADEIKEVAGFHRNHDNNMKGIVLEAADGSTLLSIVQNPQRTVHQIDSCDVDGHVYVAALHSMI